MRPNTPAFPTTPENEVRMNGTGGHGLSKREYFTAQAMVGIMAGRNNPIQNVDAADLAALATTFADAALQHLDKTRPKD